MTQVTVRITKKWASLATIPRTQIYYDNLHSRLSADFQSRILLIK